MKDPAQALHEAAYAALTEAGFNCYSDGAESTASAPYVVISVPTAPPEETRTTLTFVATLVVRIHTHFPDGQASDALMYRKRQAAREALSEAQIDLGPHYHLMRLPPPTPNVNRYETDAGQAIDGILSYAPCRVQQLS